MLGWHESYVIFEVYTETHKQFTKTQMLILPFAVETVYIRHIDYLYVVWHMRGQGETVEWQQPGRNIPSELSLCYLTNRLNQTERVSASSGLSTLERDSLHPFNRLTMTSVSQEASDSVRFTPQQTSDKVSLKSRAITSFVCLFFVFYHHINGFDALVRRE